MSPAAHASESDVFWTTVLHAPSLGCVSFVSLVPRRALTLVGAVLAGWALIVWATGGGTIVFAGLRLSSRAWARPALGGLALLLVAWSSATADERRAVLAATRRRLDASAPWLAAMLALSMAGVSAIYGAHVAAGADSSGYVSQSRLWQSGRMTVPITPVDDAPWPERGRRVMPLGYAPTPTPDVLAPTYAPGLPWLMALGAMLVGEVGRYVWTPLATGLLVWATFAWTRRDAPPSVALAASLLVATSPPVLFAAMQTMTDLLAAALWALAVLAWTSVARGSTLAAGLLAAAAVAVRPNLVTVAGLVGVAGLLVPVAPVSTRLRRLAVFGLPLLAVAATIATLNARFWGSPLTSGYGGLGAIFQRENVSGNLARLVGWAVETHAYWLLIALPALAGALASASPARRGHWWVAVAVLLGTAASYLPYAVFQEWAYLRFYLPAWPFLATAVTLLAWRALSRVSADGAVVTVLLVGVLLAVSATRFSAAFGVFDFWRGEQRYLAVAQWLRDRTLSADRAMTVQLSGAIADGSSRSIVRWDHVDPGALDSVVERLARRGVTTWLVVEDWEEDPFRARFGATARGRLDWAPTAEARVGTMRVRIYDLTTPTRATAPSLIRVVHGGPWPWARRPTASRTSK